MMRISKADFDALPKIAKLLKRAVPLSMIECRDNPQQRAHQKYRNQRIVDPDGTKFDSKAEHKFWHHCKLRERAKEICNLERQVVFVLAPGVMIAGRKRPPLRYVADMQWNEVAKDADSQRLLKLLVDTK